MDEFKVGDRVMIPGVVDHSNDVNGWLRVSIIQTEGAPGLYIPKAGVVLAPVELPTVPGSIVELSDGINQLAYVGKESWILLGNLKDPTYGCGDLFDSDWVREQGFRVIYDRGAVSDGA